MKKGLLSKEDMEQIIIDSLYDKRLIDKEIYYKCSKLHIRMLPFDNRTTDPEKLKIRRQAIESKIDEVNESLENFTETHDTLEENISSLESRHEILSKENESNKEKMNIQSEQLTNMVNDAQDTVDNFSDNFNNTKLGMEINLLQDIINGEYEEEDEEDKTFFSEKLENIRSSLNEISKNIQNYLSGSDGFIDGKLFENLTKQIDDFEEDYKEVRTVDEGEMPLVQSFLRDLRQNIQFNKVYEEHQKTNTQYMKNSHELNIINSALKEADDALMRINKDIAKSEGIRNDYEIELDKINKKTG